MPITLPNANNVVPVDPLPYHANATDQRRIDATAAIRDEFRRLNPFLNENPLFDNSKSPPTARTDVKFEEFQAAQSLHQHAWLQARGGTHTFAFGSAQSLTFVASAVTERVYNVEGLQIGTISAMPKADQERIAATDAFRGGGGVGDRLGYWPSDQSGHTSSTAARNALLSNVANFETAVSGTTLPSDVKQLFTDQARNIRTRLEASAIFNPDAVQNAVSDLTGRLNRMHEFYKDARGHIPTDGSPPTQPDDESVVLDIPSIVEAYQSFVEAEKRIRNADNRMAQLTYLASRGLPTLDLPSLIVRFQTLYEDKAKASAEADTAEVRALNALLRDYGEMQRMVNQVSGSIDPNEPEDRAALEVPGDERIKRMFNRGTAGDGHPMERLGQITRPTLEVSKISFTGFKHPYGEWDNGFGDGSNTSEEAIHPDTVKYMRDALGMNVLPPAFQEGGLLHFGGAENHWYFSEWAHKIRTWFEDNKKNAHMREAVSNQLGLKFSLDEGQMHDLHDHYHDLDNFEVYVQAQVPNPPTNEELELQISSVWVDFLFDENWHENEKSNFMPPNYERFFGDGWQLEDDFLSKLDYNDDKNDPNTVIEVPRLFKSQWDGYNTRLADAVTLLNQDNQVRQNGINQSNSQANRHFELVSNTLRRMFDLMQTIGRSTA